MASPDDHMAQLGIDSSVRPFVGVRARTMAGGTPRQSDDIGAPNAQGGVALRVPPAARLRTGTPAH
jgi:hypothetical protein